MILVGLVAVLLIGVRCMFSALLAFPLYWAWNESIATAMGAPQMTWGTAFSTLVVLSIVGGYFGKDSAAKKS